MEKITGTIVAAVQNFSGSGVTQAFGQVLSKTLSSMPEWAVNIIEPIDSLLKSTVFPFCVQNSAFILSGAFAFVMLSSAMYASNVAIDNKRELVYLAQNSRVVESNDKKGFGLKREINRNYENIYSISNKKLTSKELEKELDQLFILNDLVVPHYDLEKLVSSIKNINSSVAFHESCEMQIKEKLLELDWNFNVVNQAFKIIDMHLDNELSTTYSNMQSYDLSSRMKVVKKLAKKGFTSKHQKRVLLKKGMSLKHVEKILKRIHKVQNLNNKIQRLHERKIQRAIRKNTLQNS